MLKFCWAKRKRRSQQASEPKPYKSNVPRHIIRKYWAEPDQTDHEGMVVYVGESGSWLTKVSDRDLESMKEHSYEYVAPIRSSTHLIMLFPETSYTIRVEVTEEILQKLLEGDNPVSFGYIEPTNLDEETKLALKANDKEV